MVIGWLDGLSVIRCQDVSMGTARCLAAPQTLRTAFGDAGPACSSCARVRIHIRIELGFAPPDTPPVAQSRAWTVVPQTALHGRPDSHGAPPVWRLASGARAVSDLAAQIGGRSILLHWRPATNHEPRRKRDPFILRRAGEGRDMATEGDDNLNEAQHDRPWKDAEQLDLAQVGADVKHARGCTTQPKGAMRSVRSVASQSHDGLARTSTTAPSTLVTRMLSRVPHSRTVLVRDKGPNARRTDREH